MRINALSAIAERAANLALLAVAVAEYDDRTTPVYASIPPRTMQEGLTVLLDDLMQQLRAEVEAEVPDISPITLSLASTATETAVNLIMDDSRFCDYQAHTDVTVQTLSALALELDALTGGRC